MPWNDVGKPTDELSPGWPENDTASSLFAFLKQAIQEAREVEKHIHTHEKWFGDAAVPVGETHVADRLGPSIAAFPLSEPMYLSAIVSSGSL